MLSQAAGFRKAGAPFDRAAPVCYILSMKKFIIVYLVWNLIVFLVYGIDKLKAKRGSWRVSEKALIICALLMGAPGALAGMKVFRHKTKHRLFTVGVPLCLILNLAAAFAVWKYVLPLF
jgi:uncharacterized membrane protein YsdA (DUF1294 family)